MWFVSEAHSAQLGELGRQEEGLLDGAVEAAELKAVADRLWATKSMDFAERFEIMTDKICVDPTA